MTKTKLTQLAHDVYSLARLECTPTKGFSKALLLKEKAAFKKGIKLHIEALIHKATTRRRLPGHE